jgi:hypothetical protein
MSFFDRDIKFQSIYFKIEQNSSEIYNREKKNLIQSILCILSYFFEFHITPIFFGFY